MCSFFCQTSCQSGASWLLPQHVAGLVTFDPDSHHALLPRPQLCQLFPHHTHDQVATRDTSSQVHATTLQIHFSGGQYLKILGLYCCNYSLIKMSGVVRIAVFFKIFHIHSKSKKVNSYRLPIYINSNPGEKKYIYTKFDMPHLYTLST